MGLRWDDRVNVDPAIEHVELPEILAFPRVGGGPIAEAGKLQTWIPPARGREVLQHIWFRINGSFQIYKTKY